MKWLDVFKDARQYPQNAQGVRLRRLARPVAETRLPPAIKE